MRNYWSNFWIQGSPELITDLLGVAPTSVRLGQPYDYWDHKIERIGSEDVLLETFEFLRYIHPRLSALPEKHAYGLLFGTTVSDNGADTFHSLEPSEMKILAEMNIPVSFQTIFQTKD